MKRIFIAFLCAMTLFGVSGCAGKNEVDVEEITQKFKDEGYKVQHDATGKKFELVGDTTTLTLRYEDLEQYSGIELMDHSMVFGFVFIDKEKDEEALILFDDQCRIIYDDLGSDTFSKEDCKSDKKILDFKSDLDNQLKKVGLDYVSLFEYMNKYVRQTK